MGEIKNYEAGFDCFSFLNCFGSIAGLGHFPILGFESYTNHAQDDRVIVNDHHNFVHMETRAEDSLKTVLSLRTRKSGMSCISARAHRLLSIELSRNTRLGVCPRLGEGAFCRRRIPTRQSAGV